MSEYIVTVRYGLMAATERFSSETDGFGAVCENRGDPTNEQEKRTENYACQEYFHWG